MPSEGPRVGEACVSAEPERKSEATVRTGEEHGIIMPCVRSARPEAVFHRKPPRRGRGKPLCGLSVTGRAYPEKAYPCRLPAFTFCV